MSAEAIAFIRAWDVGPYRVELSCPKPKPGAQVAAVMTWDPQMPAKLTETELAEYRAGRDTALCDMAEQLHVRVAVLDL